MCINNSHLYARSCALVLSCSYIVNQRSSLRKLKIIWPYAETFKREASSSSYTTMSTSPSRLELLPGNVTRIMHLKLFSEMTVLVFLMVAKTIIYETTQKGLGLRLSLLTCDFEVATRCDKNCIELQRQKSPV